MTENLQGIRGEHRRFTAEEIAFFIRLQRKGKGVKRAVLAAEANISEKTLERAESGEGIGEDSLRRVALALELPETVFVDEHYIPTMEEAERLAKEEEEKRQQTHHAVPVVEVKDVRDLLAMFHGYAMVADDSNVAEVHLEAFMAIKNTLNDWGMTGSDIPSSMALDGAREVLQLIREFETLGYVVKCGTAERQLINGAPMPCTVVVAFKKPNGMAGVPDEVWLPKRMHIR